MPSTPLTRPMPTGRDPRRARLVALADGTAVLVRHQTRHDREQVLGLYDGMSPRSRQLRFFTGMPGALPARLLDALSDVDGERHVALLAIHQGRAVAAARYVRDPRDPSRADLAFAVADAFQRRGVARVLLGELVAHAARAGVRELVFDTLGENAGAQALLRSLGAEMRAGDGLVSGVLPTGGAPEPAAQAA